MKARRIRRTRIVWRRNLKLHLLLYLLALLEPTEKRLWVHPILQRRRQQGSLIPVTHIQVLDMQDSYMHRIHCSTVGRIIPETCEAIWKHLQPKYMPTPDENLWLQVSHDFGRFWQFPNCIGAIDGKHIPIKAPPNSGSWFFNYKKFFSVIFLAVADAQYRFIVVDIGGYGRQCDGSVFAKSTFSRMLCSNNLNIPEGIPLNPGGRTMPPVFVGDEAFPLKPNLLRPFPGSHLSQNRRIFNYMLSRARRVVENTFGIMASRFRIFRRTMDVHPSTADSVIKACTVLHNYLRCEDSYIPHSSDSPDAEPMVRDIVSGSSHAMHPIARVGRPASIDAIMVRDQYADYFMSEGGSVPWQDAQVGRAS